MHKWGLSLVLIFISALALSILFVPREEEVAFLHLSDKDYTIARVIYENQADSEEDPDQGSIFPLVKVLLENGETDKALAQLKKLVEDEPNNLEALQFLAKVYKDTEETHKYISTLRVIYKMKPDPELLREIIAYDDFIQAEGDQMVALQELVKKGVAKSQEIHQLATLYLEQKKTEEAIQLLQQVLPKPEDLKIFHDLFFLLDLLLKVGDPKRALTIAQEYVSPGKIGLSIDMINFFYRNKREGEALKLIQPLIKQVPFDSRVIRWQVDYHIEKKEPEKAFLLMQQLAEKKQLPTDLEGDFLEAAIEMKQPKPLGEALKIIQLKTLSNEKLLYIGQYVLEKKYAQEAHYMRIKLGQDFLSKSPLLALLLGAADTLDPSRMTKDMQNQALDKISPKDRLRFAQAFHISKSKDLEKELLEKGFSFDSITDTDVVGVAEYLIQIGLAEKALLSLLKRYPQITMAPLNFQKAWALLATANGSEDKVLDWLKDKNLEPPYLTSLYYIASHKSLPHLMEVVATSLYKLDTSADSKMRLVEAFMANKSYKKAEPYLRELAQSKSGYWEYDYIKVLQKLGKTKELNDYWNHQAVSASMDTKKKREIAYILLNNGNKREAAQIFYQLAAKEGPTNPDISQLLDIWGKNLTDEHARWIEKRTREAAFRHKKDWLKILIYRGRSKEAIKIMRDLNLTEAKEFKKLYMDALESMQDREGLRQIIAKEIEEKSDPTNLIRLVDLASMAKSPTLQKKALKKLVHVAPTHPYVLKLKAQVAIDAKNYKKARQYLDQLFQKESPDVMSLYNYGEAIRNLQGIEKAKVYYHKTLEKLRNSKEKNVDFDVIEVKALYFLGKKAESIKKNKTILAANKNNKRIRADLAHFYMDVGDLNEAEAILNE